MKTKHTKGPARRELLYHFFLRDMAVLVPKKRGAGFLMVPYGHHRFPAMSAIETVARCEVSGLDGHLSFACDRKVCSYAEKRDAFAEKIIPLLEELHGCPARLVSEEEFWTNHPVTPAARAALEKAGRGVEGGGE